MTALNVMVTGASGFVGEAVVFQLLLDKKMSPIAATRGATRFSGLCSVRLFDLVNKKCLPELDDVQVVIHAAARVHVMSDTAVDALAEFRKVNVEGTLRLAQRASESGVKRFIFVSSIKVNGESSRLGIPFKADDHPNPMDPYGISKYEAEEALKQLGSDTGMEVVIIRPPLVYGPGVKANFFSMLSWLDKGVPLPFGAIRNKRSFVAIDNLVSLIVTCIDHPAAAGQTFLVSDGEDLSTTQLLRLLSTGLGKPARLIPVPEWVLKVTASMLGKQAIAQRLCECLQVDIRKNSDLLGWVPPFKMNRAMQQTASYYLEMLKK